MSITGKEPRRRRNVTTVIIREVAADTPPAIAAQERKASEQKVERIEVDVSGKAPTVHSHAQSDVTGLAATLADLQPLNSNLISIAALTTTAFGRSFLELADAAAARTLAGALASASYTAADVLAKLLTVDGGGSGLDADTLQGFGPLTWATASHTHLQSEVTGLVASLALLAPLASPALTGTPTAPTQTAGTSDTTIATTRFVTRDFANLASPTFTGTPAVPTAAAGTNTTQVASTAFVAAAVPNASYRTILDSSGSHIAARVAGTYGLAQSQPAAKSGTGTLYPLNTIYIAAADYPSVNGLAPKLRVRAQLYVNDVAPTGNFTFALHPITRPGTSGGAGLNIYTIGAAVASSAATTITTPAADSMNTTVGSDFALPADGHYVLGVVTTATVATSSHVHMSASLQLRNA